MSAHDDSVGGAKGENPTKTRFQRLLEVLNLANLIAIPASIVAALQVWDWKDDNRKKDDQEQRAIAALEAAKTQADAGRRLADTAIAQANLAKQQAEDQKGFLKSQQDIAIQTSNSAIELKKQNELLELNSKISYFFEYQRSRPRIEFKTVKPETKISDTGNSSWAVSFENKGPTSASKVWVWSDQVVTNGDENPPVTPGCEYAGWRGELGSGHLGREGIRLNQQQIRNIASGKSFYTVYGRICYTDDEEGFHTVEFCARISGTSTKWVTYACDNRGGPAVIAWPAKFDGVRALLGQ